jgi:transcriptional regulator with XRE-family HTH domain
MLTPLKFWRLQRGVQQIVVAQHAGIARSRLSEIECGHVAARDDELQRLAAVLRVPVAAFEQNLDDGDEGHGARTSQDGDAADSRSTQRTSGSKAGG